ncbi:MAG: HD domain-containing protein [Myxococcales bacterium]|nr:HD domain-containing protein [Myxococcales bacterium]
MSTSTEVVTLLPDTPLVREARGILERAAPSTLVAHSIRSFLYGRAYGRSHAMGCDDEEGLLLAALFHDLGFCPEHQDRRLPFQVVGSRALREFLSEQGTEPERISALVDAIDFHMQLLPRWSKGNTAGLLQVGAWMDITGLRRWGISSDARTIEGAYPRDGIRLRFYGFLFGSFGGVGSCVGTLFPGRYRE